MRLTRPGDSKRSALRGLMAAAAAMLFVSGCANGPVIIPPSEQPLTKESLMLLGKKGMETSAPIYVRIFKEESELEVWKARSDGRFYHFKTYPICSWSGELGPKLATGDRQAPEGFYTINPKQMKPDSGYYLAFNLGFPNAYDKSQGRTGQFVMIHGKCKSAGCYAMTDALVEEIYALARDALRGGQPNFQVHAFPFRMTDEKLARYKTHKWFSFWKTLKEGYDAFEVTRVPPNVVVCERKYVVNVMSPAFGDIDPEGRCPRFERPSFTPFSAIPAEQKLASERVYVGGPKTRSAAGVEPTDAFNAPVATGMSRMPAPERASALGLRQ